MTPLEQAEFRMWLDELDALDDHRRRVAGMMVCKLAGLSETVRALAADGALRPPPAWPLVDIVPERCVVAGEHRHLACLVRTSVGGGVVSERVMVGMARGGLPEGALADAVERGRRELERRIGAFVVGN